MKAKKGQKTVHISVSKVAYHKQNGESVTERNTIAIPDGNDFNQFLQTLKMHGFINVKVIDYTIAGISDKSNLNKYQGLIDKVLEKEVIKSELEEQKEINKKLLERIEALESQNNTEPKELYFEKYEELYGKKPHLRMKSENILLAIKDKMTDEEFEEYENNLK